MALAKLRDLAAKAGRWPGLTAPAAHTTAVVADRFDAMTWRDTYDQAPALRELALARMSELRCTARQRWLIRPDFALYVLVPAEFVAG